MEVSSKVLKRAKQLKALAERGEGAEREKAFNLYKKHLETNGITEEDLGLNELQFHYFKYGSGQRDMLSMIMCHVVANALILTDSKKKSILFAKCTNEEATKIRQMFAFYIEAYRIEESYFLTAFLHRNQLTPNIVQEKGECGEQKAAVNVKNETDVNFEIKTEPAPVESVEYTPYEQRKIKGLMSWMPHYDFAGELLNSGSH